jgi:hypothetical protein
MTQQELEIKANARGLQLVNVLTECGIVLDERQARLVVVQAMLILLEGIDFGITATKIQFEPLMKGGEKLNG